MMKFLSIALLIANFIIYLNAADITVTIEAPFVQNSTAVFDYYGVQTFNSFPIGITESIRSNFTRTANVIGTYHEIYVVTRDKYGGAGGVGRYPIANPTNPYSLTFEQVGKRRLNYFGYWLSAVDDGNQVDFYSKGRRIAEFTSGHLLEFLQKRPEYLGNPSSNPRKNAGDPYVFVNFFCNDCVIDEVRFTQRRDSKYNHETDNHTVGYFTATSGDVLQTVPSSESIDGGAHVGAVVGASAGAIALLGAVGGGTYFARRRTQAVDLTSDAFESIDEQDVPDRDLVADHTYA